MVTQHMNCCATVLLRYYGYATVCIGHVTKEIPTCHNMFVLGNQVKSHKFTSWTLNHFRPVVGLRWRLICWRQGLCIPALYEVSLALRNFIWFLNTKRQLSDWFVWLWWGETMSQKNRGHHCPIVHPPGECEWRAVVLMIPAGDNSWLVYQSALAVLPAETSGNGRRSENFHRLWRVWTRDPYV
jgi:hypothetical protein